MGAVTAATFHVPVLGTAVARAAAGCRRAVDATAGGGGHVALLLEQGTEVLAIDRDPEAIEVARSRLAGQRVRFVPGRFADPAVLEQVRAFRPEFVLLDLGVSSHQLDTGERGFSFRPGVPLDMRMTPLEPAVPTAADLLNTAPETELARILRDGGDEPRAKRLARTIVRRRQRRRFAVSDDLVGAIREALGSRTGPADFARLFQAVRIEVNQERAELERGLPALRDALEPGGRIVVITYHSGEDRAVKQAFAEWASACVCPPGLPTCVCRGRPLGLRDPRRPVLPEPAEVVANPRARSAKLRGFRKAHGA